MTAASLSTVLRAAAAWSLALLLFFPLGWLFLTAFKTELQAIAVPPLFVFEPTLDNFGEVQQRSNYLLHARNSLVTSLGPPWRAWPSPCLPPIRWPSFARGAHAMC